MMVLPLPVVILTPADCPKKLLKLPVVKLLPALPKAALLRPVVNFCSEEYPTAML